MILTSLPDAKFIHQAADKGECPLTVGNDYTPIREIGNAVVISNDKGDDTLIVCRSRFQ